MVTAHELKVALKEEAKQIIIPAHDLWARLHWSLRTAELSRPQHSAPARPARGARGPAGRRTRRQLP